MTYTLNQWNELMNLQPSAVVVRETTAHQVRLYLSTLRAGEKIGTNDLVEALYPRAVADETLEGDIARTRLYQVLQVLTNTALSDCCLKGKANGKYMGHTKRPWLWFKPPEREMCCMCGQSLPIEALT